MKELADCEELDSMLKYQVSEMQRNEQELSRQLEVMKKENNDLVQPQLKKVQDDINYLKVETNTHQTNLDLERKRKADITAKIEVLYE